MSEPILKAFKSLDRWVQKYGNTTLFAIILSIALSLAIWGKRLESHATADEVKGEAFERRFTEVENRVRADAIRIGDLNSQLAHINGKLDVLLMRVK
jgi:TolA-binding protein